MVLGAFRNLHRNAARNRLVDLRRRTLRIGLDGRLASVHLHADRHVERQRAEHLDLVVLGHPVAAAGTENGFGVAALGADVDAHVLDDAEDGNADFLEHLEALPRIEQGDVLRRGDDDRTRYRHLLCQGELDVAGARRHVDHQIIHVAPARLGQQLGQRLGHHRAAPDHGLLGIDEEADRHGLQPVRLHRLEPLAVGRLGAAAADAQHGRQRGAVDVGIEQAYCGALGRQRQRQIDGGGRLADATLAAGHGDDVLDAGNQLDALLHGMRDHFRKDVGADVADAGDRFQLRDHGRAQPFDLALRRIAEFNIERDVIAGNLDVLGTAAADEILAGVGVDDFLECGLNALFGDGHERPLLVTNCWKENEVLVKANAGLGRYAGTKTSCFSEGLRRLYRR